MTNIPTLTLPDCVVLHYFPDPLFSIHLNCMYGLLRVPTAGGLQTGAADADLLRHRLLPGEYCWIYCNYFQKIFCVRKFFKHLLHQ